MKQILKTHSDLYFENAFKARSPYTFVTVLREWRVYVPVIHFRSSIVAG